MGDSSWILYLLGGGTFGSLITAAVNVIASKIRNKEQKGIDVTALTSQIADAYQKTLETTSEFHQKTIAELKQRDAEHEARYNNAMTALEETRLTISAAYECEYLKSGTNKTCPVLNSNRNICSKRCLEKGGKCHE